jgi:hypothetical protein
MWKLMTIVITVISITVGALYIKAMLDFKKEAAEYLDNKKNDITKEPKPEETLNTKSSISNHNIDNEISGENTNKPNEDSKPPEALKDRQKLVVNTLYKDLFYELILNEEELDEFKDLIIDSLTSDMNISNSHFDNKEAKIKEFLGEQDYESYKQYNKTLIHRVNIILYKRQLALSNMTLSEEQETQLLEIMIEESKDALISDFDNDSKIIEHRTPEPTDNLLEQIAESNKNILESSRLFLDTEQVDVLEKFLNTIRNNKQIDLAMLAESYNNKNQSEN